MVEIRLPGTLPIFPLRGALLLPRGRLPLNIFEPRYLAMTDHALGHGRMIGMVRPRQDNGADLYDIGCAGRISSFSETGDGRYLISLTGVSRFKITNELPQTQPYREVVPEWEIFHHDLLPEQTQPLTQSAVLLDYLKDYLDQSGLKADLPALVKASPESLINSIAMSCPFSADEKQALLEAETLEDRTRCLITCLSFALAQMQSDDDDDNGKKRQLQ